MFPSLPKEMWVVLSAVLAYVFGSFAFNYLRRRRRNAILEQLAEALGLSYYPEGGYAAVQGYVNGRTMNLNNRSSGEKSRMMCGEIYGAEISFTETTYWVRYNQSERQRVRSEIFIPFQSQKPPAFRLARRPWWARFLCKVLNVAYRDEDIGFPSHPNFAKQYRVTGPDENLILALFDDELVNYVEGWQLDALSAVASLPGADGGLVFSLKESSYGAHPRVVQHAMIKAVKFYRLACEKSGHLVYESDNLRANETVSEVGDLSQVARGKWSPEQLEGEALMSVLPANESNAWRALQLGCAYICAADQRLSSTEQKWLEKSLGEGSSQQILALIQEQGADGLYSSMTGLSLNLLQREREELRRCANLWRELMDTDGAEDTEAQALKEVHEAFGLSFETRRI